MTSKFPEIPSIDIKPLFINDKVAKQNTIRAIGEACRTKGFFSVYNHGIDTITIEKTFEQAKRFFDLSYAEKQKFNHKQSHAYRGYFAIGEEKLDINYQGDLKEGFNIGYEFSPDDPLVLARKPFYAPNLWPQNLPGWREQMETYYHAMENLCNALLRAIANYLQVADNFFISDEQPALTSLRLLKYPSQQFPEPDLKRMGAGAHTDYGCITLLVQDGLPCLQACDPASGEWINVPSMKDVFICNVGDMLQRWTNDLFVSAEHRVINQTGRDRFSMPFFYNPHYDAIVSCLDSCQSASNPPRYAPITCGEYLIYKLKQAFAAEKK